MAFRRAYKTGLLHSVLDEPSVFHHFLLNIHLPVPDGDSQARGGAVHRVRAMSRRPRRLQHVLRR